MLARLPLLLLRRAGVSSFQRLRTAAWLALQPVSLMRSRASLWNAWLQLPTHQTDLRRGAVP